MTTSGVWRIAIPTPLRRCFDYLPCETRTPIKPGVRVQVPFGSRTLVGILIKVAPSTSIELTKLKSAHAVIDTTPILDARLLQLCEWASGYYHYGLGEVFTSALPKYVRAGKMAPKQKTKNSAMVSPPPSAPESALLLNPEQQQALSTILQKSSFHVSLIAGVTGSGKTEIYLQAIDAILKRNRSALVLVPEINLTPQTVTRFQKRFQIPIAVIHSGLGDRERARIWWHVHEDKYKIVIGTRSAIFAPLKQLGIIIIDEEQDSSFKSQSQVRYSARNLAVMRAKMEDIPILLGSATPSAETYYNAQRGHYHLLTLSERAGLAQLPEITILDACQQSMQAGLSTPLIEAIRKTLRENKQVLIFLNRRGYAPVMICHHCRHMVHCTRCDAKMTLHTSPSRLVCHHCDKKMPLLRICPECHQAELVPLGHGTEQLEETLASLFPEYRLLRMDRDTISNHQDLEDKLEQIHSGNADIIIGTQMLAKGHHFEKLGLSVIINIDNSLFSIDFRALEHVAQLIIQVAGRSGRCVEKGEVILQTYYPKHPPLQRLLQEGYFSFMNALLIERQAAKLPPFSFQAAIWAQSTTKQAPIIALENLKKLLQPTVYNTQTKIFGPIPAFMERRAGHFRQLLIIQADSRLALKECLQKLCMHLDNHATAASARSVRSVRWTIDVDPIETG